MEGEKRGGHVRAGEDEGAGVVVEGGEAGGGIGRSFFKGSDEPGDDVGRGGELFGAEVLRWVRSLVLGGFLRHGRSTYLAFFTDEAPGVVGEGPQGPVAAGEVAEEVD